MSNTPRIYDLFKRASTIIVTRETRHIHASWEEAIAAPALKPERPATRHAASPQIMLRGPFEDDAELINVIFYVGIGFIEVRRLDAEHCTYETTVIGGDGIEERDAFMTAARDLFFSDVRFASKIHA